jgi:hypothetical protein
MENKQLDLFLRPQDKKEQSKFPSEPLISCSCCPARLPRFYFVATQWGRLCPECYKSYNDHRDQGRLPRELRDYD